MVALADRQVTEPALGVTSLADVQQPGTGNVHTADDVAGHGCIIRSRRVGQELTDVMREPVAAILPRQNALWVGESSMAARQRPNASSAGLVSMPVNSGAEVRRCRGTARPSSRRVLALRLAACAAHIQDRLTFCDLLPAT
jgi:hypothetical protein